LLFKLLGVMLLTFTAHSQVSRNFNKSSQPKIEAGIGAFGLDIPNYPGAASNTLRYIPFPWIIYRSDFLHSDEEGTRAKLFYSKHFEIGLSGGLNFPIESNENAARSGMPDTDILVGIGPALLFRIIQGHDTHRLTAGLGLRVNLSVNEQWSFTDQGWIVEPNIRYWATLSDKITLFSALSFSYADRRYNSFFYEVPFEFTNSNRDTFKTEEGMVDIAGSLGFSIEYSEKLIFFAGQFFSNLSTAANKNSPLVENTHTSGYVVGFRWQFYESEEMVTRK
jgi:outer membrane protein